MFRCSRLTCYFVQQTQFAGTLALRKQRGSMYNAMKRIIKPKTLRMIMTLSSMLNGCWWTLLFCGRDSDIAKEESMPSAPYSEAVTVTSDMRPLQASSSFSKRGAVTTTSGIRPLHASSSSPLWQSMIITSGMKPVPSIVVFSDDSEAAKPYKPTIHITINRYLNTTTSLYQLNKLPLSAVQRYDYTVTNTSKHITQGHQIARATLIKAVQF